MPKHAKMMEVFATVYILTLPFYLTLQVNSGKPAKSQSR